MDSVSTQTMASRRRDRARGSLTGAGLGDALGAAFERRTGPADLAIREYESSPRPLRYTDDTALTIAVAEHLVHRASIGDHVLNETELATTLAHAWQAEPWRGFGTGATELFTKVSAGQSWRTSATTLFGGQGSFGNGGAMRCSPVALVAQSPHHAAELGKRSALVTHTHPDGQHGAAVQSCAVHVALHHRDGQPLDAERFLDRLVKTVRDPRWAERIEAVRRLLSCSDARRAASELGNDARATHSVPMALWAFLNHHDDPVEAIRQCIRGGGDTDTIASMSGALVGALNGLSALPPHLVRRLEGAPRLTELADRLSSRTELIHI